MTDLTALSTKLAALVAEDDVFTDDGARVISQAGEPAPLAAILREVDDTVLERTLVFGMGEADVHIVVAGRRLRGIVDVAGDAPGIEAVVGEVLSREEPETVQAVGSLLASMGEAAGRITVRSTPTRPIGSSGDAGISASGLADLWIVDMDATPAPAIDRFLTANAEAMLGVLTVTGGKVGNGTGDAAPLQAIWAGQVNDFRARHDKFRQGDDGPVIICLDNAIDGKIGVALALQGDDACLFSYAPDDLPAILSSWAAITG
ncbi:hypothetical protein [Yoonia sp. 2307UL14-13]|uniref:hypothetical protein n=1 Tax=Yoonia sp. 2307UL14-13 TaxID=3126506 RepID=UPI0030B60C48